MKNLFIIFCNLLFFIVNSQEIVYVYNIKLNDYSNAPEFKRVETQLKYVGKNNNERIFFDSYDIINFYQSYPSADGNDLLSYFTFETKNIDLAADLISNFPGKYILYEDFTGMEVQFADEYTNDYGNTLPTGFTNSGVNFEFRNLDYIHVPKAWEYTMGNINTIIGIQDGRIDATDADLSKTSFMTSYNDYGGVYDPTEQGTYHGSSVAAIAAAQGDNFHGMVGICPNCDIVATGMNGLPQTAYNKLFELKNAGARVINMSWTTTRYGSANKMAEGNSLQKIIDTLHCQGVILIAAGGNANSWNSQNGNPSGSLYYYPASHEHVISVSSINFWNDFGDETEIWPGYTEDVSLYVKDMISDKVFTDYGGNGPTPTYLGHTSNELIDICAPAYTVLSYGKWLGEGSLARGGATSSATPHVTGTVGLMLTLNNCLSANEVEAILKLTSKQIEKLPGNEPFIGRSGSGKLETGDAVEFVDAMMQPTGNALIDGQDFYRFDFKLKHINNKLTISNQIFRDNCTADFTAKKVIEILPGSDFKPGTSGFVDLKIDSGIVVCDIEDEDCEPPVPPKDRIKQTESKQMELKSKLYPNPNKGIFELVFGSDLGKNVNIEVYDIYGKIVYTNSADTASFIVDIPNLSTGMYIVKLSSENHIETIKFIKE